LFLLLVLLYSSPIFNTNIILYAYLYAYVYLYLCALSVSTSTPMPTGEDGQRGGFPRRRANVLREAVRLGQVCYAMLCCAMLCYAVLCICICICINSTIHTTSTTHNYPHYPHYPHYPPAISRTGTTKGSWGWARSQTSASPPPARCMPFMYGIA
jgi:hypothetical protein